MPPPIVEYKASIIVSSPTDDASAIARKLGGAPTRSWKIGDPAIPGAANKQKENAWILDAGVSSDDRSLDDTVSRVLRLWVGMGLRTTPEYECAIQCVVFATGREAILHFRKATIEMLAKLNAEVDIDYYVLPDE
jgi:hypothetical protein